MAFSFLAGRLNRFRVRMALFSNIVWSIPIPIRGYSFIADGYGNPDATT